MDNFPRINEFNRDKFKERVTISDIDQVIDHNGKRIGLEGKLVDDIDDTVWIKVCQWKIMRSVNDDWIPLFYVFHTATFDKFKWIPADDLKRWPKREEKDDKWCMRIPLHSWDTLTEDEYFQRIYEETGAERKDE